VYAAGLVGAQEELPRGNIALMSQCPRRFLPLAFAAAVGLLTGSAVLTGELVDNTVFATRGAVSAPVHTGFTRRAYYVPMADGVRLAMTVYLPTGGAPTARFPVLLWYLPGHRESIDPATGRILPAYTDADLRFFTSHGYALAVAEMRGSGASFGSRELDRGPQIGRDGRALVDWIVAQSWSSGSVGMVGASYQGFSQYATAAEQPPALRAIFPEIAGFDDYTSMFHPGGIANVALSEFATASIVRDDLNHYESSASRPRYPSVPVIDEDGDGELADEIPLDRNGNGSFLDDGEPGYADGLPRQHIYYLATRDHQKNSNLTLEALAAAPFRDSRVNATTYTYHDIDPSTRPQRIATAGIAVYNRGGWFDYHARDTVMWQATLSGRTPSFLMMAPTGHGGFPAEGSEAIYRAGPYFRLFADTTSTSATLNQEKLRFFDRYVRGIDNGFDRQPPVLLYVMGRGWRAEQRWPLASQRLTDFYFGADGALSPRAGPRGTDQYVVDLAADSRSNGANRWNYGISLARAPMTLTASDHQRRGYTSEPLMADLEVTGHPIATIHLSSDTGDADVFVYLEDVSPRGEALLVTEGQLRANYPRVYPIQQLLGIGGGTLRVRPELPWHGFRAGDYVPDPFADGKVQALRLDLMPTSWVFKAGHRIRVSLAGADVPSFALHPALKSVKGAAPVWTVHRGASLSRISLPVIPSQPGR
jgi:putative CocE/NonD family hydrolase